MLDIQKAGDAVIDAVKKYVAKSFSDYSNEISARVDGLEQRVASIPAGPQGERGEKGLDGANGVGGKDGIQGEKGLDGSDGKDGIDGKQGEPGSDGENGKSAYELAVEKGFTGNEESWIKSLKGSDGKDGSDGIDGKDADEETVIKTVSDKLTVNIAVRIDESLKGLVDEIDTAIKSLPVPKDGIDGKDGAPGINGKDADPIHPDTIARLVLEAVQKAMADAPQAKNGEPGRDALALDVLPGIDETKSYPRGTFAEYRGGIIRAIRNTDPVDGNLDKAGWVVSMNGIADEAEETLDEGRTIVRVTTYTSGKQVKREIKTSLIIWRGVWREGEYGLGDVVTWGGSTWHCQEKTSDKPDSGSASWKLMVKRGSPGKDAVIPEKKSENSVVRVK